MTNSSAHKPATPDYPRESRKNAFVREMLRLLVKTQKARRLYDAKNAVAERLEHELHQRLSSLVEEHGEVHLVVLESELRSEDEVVHESHDRADSLPFLLYRDGVRRLSFGPGLEIEELRLFLSCLNRVALLTNDQEDLVTLLWEQDFRSIRYFAIEELSRNESYPRLSDSLGSGGDGGAGVATEAVRLDLKQPLATLPVEACRLEGTEIEALQNELLAEERAPFPQLVSELALDLVLVEDDPDVAKEMVAIADRLIADGDVIEVVGMHEHVEGLASMVFRGSKAALRLSSELTRALTEPGRFERFMERVERVHAPRPESLTVFLARLGPSVGPALVPWMGRFSSPPYRRAVTTALLHLPDGLSVLANALPTGAPPDEPQALLHRRQLVREAVHAAGRHAFQQAQPLLTSLLASADAEARRESFLALSRYPDEQVVAASLERVLDPDPEVRTAALDALVKRGRADLGLSILERISASERFEKLALLEKRRLFAAIAKLSGEYALDALQRVLLSGEDHWFAKQKDRELAEAVAHGIRLTGGARAKRILQEAAERGPKLARQACLKELGSPRS
jgi:hypothetical protein